MEEEDRLRGNEIERRINEKEGRETKEISPRQPLPWQLASTGWMTGCWAVSRLT